MRQDFQDIVVEEPEEPSESEFTFELFKTNNSFNFFVDYFSEKNGRIIELKDKKEKIEQRLTEVGLRKNS